MPLVNQPGSVWEYGIGIDWAGIVLERATGIRLNDWIQQYIAQPLGLKNLNMLPTSEMKKNLAYMHQKWPGQSAAEERDHIYREPIIAESEEEKKHIFHSGGAGAFAQPKEYVQVLVALLNDGTHPKGGAILKKETVEEMFKNQIPEFPDFARQGIPAAKSEQTNAMPEMYPQEGMSFFSHLSRFAMLSTRVRTFWANQVSYIGNPPQGWGLSFFLTIEEGGTGRGRNTAWWAGIANLFWWCDREKGVAGMIASQVMPFGDMNVLGQWITNEAEVYNALK